MVGVSVGLSLQKRSGKCQIIFKEPRKEEDEIIRKIYVEVENDLKVYFLEYMVVMGDIDCLITLRLNEDFLENKKSENYGLYLHYEIDFNLRRTFVKRIEKVTHNFGISTNIELSQEKMNSLQNLIDKVSFEDMERI